MDLSIQISGIDSVISDLDHIKCSMKLFRDGDMSQAKDIYNELINTAFYIENVSDDFYDMVGLGDDSDNS